MYNSDLENEPLFMQFYSNKEEEGLGFNESLQIPFLSMSQADGLNESTKFNLHEFQKGPELIKINDKKKTKCSPIKKQGGTSDSKNKNLFYTHKEKAPENCLTDAKNGSGKVEEEKIVNSKTKDSSEESVKTSSKINLFTTHKFQQRIDYAKNHFKMYLSKYLTAKANALITKSKLPKLYKQKISLPNYRSFTGNPKEKDNIEFLSFTIQRIFGYHKEGCKNYKYQKKNAKIIEDILNWIEWQTNIQKYEEITSFFKTELSKEIENFYESKLFKVYANNNKTKILDVEFERQKGFSLLEKNGFLKMVEQFKKY